MSTANPYKFPCDVYNAVAEARETDPVKAVRKLHAYTAAECPDSILGLASLPVRHTTVIEKDEAEKTVFDFVEGRR